MYFSFCQIFRSVSGRHFAFPTAVRIPPQVLFLSGADFHPLGIPDDAFYNLHLRRLDDQMPILVFCVSKETVVVDLPLAILVSVLQSQFDVLAQGLAFLLCEARHNGNNS